MTRQNERAAQAEKIKAMALVQGTELIDTIVESDVLLGRPEFSPHNQPNSELSS